MYASSEERNTPNFIYFYPLISYWCLPLVEARGRRSWVEPSMGSAKGMRYDSGSKWRIGNIMSYCSSTFSLKQMSSSRCLNHLPVLSSGPCQGCHYPLHLPGWNLRKYYNAHSISSAHKFSIPYLALKNLTGLNQTTVKIFYKCEIAWFYGTPQSIVISLKFSSMSLCLEQDYNSIFRAESVPNTSSNSLWALLGSILLGSVLR